MESNFDSIMAKQKVHYEDIKLLVEQRIDKYRDKSFIEKYALYMGMVQILELQIKQILHSKFSFETDEQFERLEKMTLGQAVRCLKDKNVRPDIIHLLEHNRDNRNDMAHSFLANTIMNTSLGFSLGSIEFRQLDKYIVELENVILFWEWCIHNDALLPDD